MLMIRRVINSNRAQRGCFFFALWYLESPESSVCDTACNLCRLFGDGGGSVPDLVGFSAWSLSMGRFELPWSMRDGFQEWAYWEEERRDSTSQQVERDSLALEITCYQVCYILFIQPITSPAWAWGWEIGIGSGRACGPKSIAVAIWKIQSVPQSGGVSHKLSSS